MIGLKLILHKGIERELQLGSIWNSETIEKSDLCVNL